jgi:hypothetical protein
MIINKAKQLVSVFLNLFEYKNKNLFVTKSVDCTLDLNGHNYSPLYLGLKWKLQNFKIDLFHINYYFNGHEWFNLFFILRCFQKLGYSETAACRLALKLLSPKSLFLIDLNISLNLAANELGIPLYYVQHGVICKNHAVWSTLFGSNLSCAFLLYKQIPEDVFNSNTKTFIIGNPAFYPFFDDLQFSLKSKLPETFHSSTGNELPGILITLTYSNPSYKFFTPELEEFINTNLTNYNWFVRIHPMLINDKDFNHDFNIYLNSKFSNYAINRFNIEKASKIPLSFLLKSIDYHITIESSVIIDAEYFGIPSLILNNRLFHLSPTGETIPPYGGPHFFSEQLNNGILKIFPNDYDKIEDWICQARSEKDYCRFQSDDLEFDFFVRDFISLI